MNEWPTNAESENEDEKKVGNLQWELSRTGWNFEGARYEKEIFELRAPFEKILQELSEDIEHGNIQFIIGDDASGRIPTMVLRRCIAKLYEERGYPTPPTFFVNGPGSGADLTQDQIDERTSRISEYLDKRLSDRDPDRKTILVTEAIMTGFSLKPLFLACKNLHMPVEIVTVGIERPHDAIQQNFGVPVHYGMEGTPDVYNKPAFAGVYKERPHMFDSFGERNKETVPMFSKAYKKSMPKHRQAETQRWLNEIRREMHVLSDELIEGYRAMKKQKKLE
jgi:hypothetical protein